MSSNKEAQAARSAADRRLREAFPDEFEAFMHEEHAKRGLTWNRRATPEERARREQEEREAKVRYRIEQEAKKIGLKVSFTEEPETIAEKVTRISTEAEDAEREQLRAEAADLDWKDMTEEQRAAIAGTRAPRSDAEEEAAWA